MYNVVLPEATSTDATPTAGVSVEDALGNGILQQATLLAGKAGCNRVVLSVLPVEVPDAPPTDEIEVLTAALHAAKGLPVRVRRDMVGSAGRALIRRTPGVSTDEWNQFFALAHDLMAAEKK